MGREIERKFLVLDDRWRAAATSSKHIRQGYLAAGPNATVRVRVSGPRAWLTIKGDATGIARAEFEYEIPLPDADHLLAHHCLLGRVEKTRHFVPHGSLVIEVDEFHGENEGLVIAEVELEAVDTAFAPPPWLGAEVTDDIRYYNAYLARYPYRRWSST